MARVARELADLRVDTPPPVALFDDGTHAVYWLGIPDETAFRCNVYLIREGDVALVVDPGNRRYFEYVRARVAEIVEPATVGGMILCHQDPDVAASMTDWLALNPRMVVYATARARVLLNHYGRSDFEFRDVEREPEIELPAGGRLRFVPAPFLHFAGAIATYDARARFLFSGDVWAALDLDWTLVVNDFEAHVPKLDLFHVDYMASNVAARGFVGRLEGLPIDAILPQHGSVIGPQHVGAALDYLRELRCGTDIIYAGA